MNRRLLIGVALIVLGVLVVLVGAFPSLLGLEGSRPRARARFGWKQIAAVVVGAGLLTAGLVSALRGRRATRGETGHGV